MKSKPKRVPIRNILLRTLAVTGIIGVALIAPKMTRLLKELDRPAKNRARLYQRISQAIIGLERNGLVTVSGTFGQRKVVLTERGRELLEKIEFNEYEIPEPAFWDGKWRVLMFDITEKRRRFRNQLRRLLEGAGFFRLQDSVWVYPYACDEFVALIRANLRSGVGEVRVFTADALESDSALRAHFRI